MSLPLPYGNKPAGVEREPPAPGAPRPYIERLRQAPELVEKVGPSRNSVVSALPTASAVLLIGGAVAPVAYAHPAIRAALFEPLARASDPLSMGLVFAADAVWYGWQGALLLSIAAVLGFAAWRLAAGGSAWLAGRGRLAVSSAVFALLALASAVGVMGLSQGDLVYSAGAAWVLMTGAGGAYGAWAAQSRRDFQASVGGAAALLMGGRFVFGGVALLCLALSDKEFPGQAVAPYSWRKSQVSIEPVRARPAPTFEEADWDALWRARAARAWAPTAAGLLLVIGALAPFGYWPPFRDALFGPLVEALMPLTAFVPIVSDAFWSLNPLFVAYIAVTSLVAAGAARFAFAGRRPGAVAAGAVILLASGRVITGLAVLVVLTLTYDQFRARHDGPGGTGAAEGQDSAAPVR